MGTAEELERLADLHRRGAIDDGEFRRAKNTVIDGTSRPPSRRPWIIALSGLVAIAAVVVVAIVLGSRDDDADDRTFVMDGHSMDPTFTDGDELRLEPVDTVERGDIVVVHLLTGAAERDVVKRVIALPGETIEMRNCVVTIGGGELDEPYLDPAEIGTENLCGGDFGPVVIPQDHVFVVGDNRDGSQDSRALGPFAVAEVTGVVNAVRSPGGDWQSLE